MKQTAVFILVLIFIGCKSKMDDTVKKGYFDNCKKGNVEQLINGFFANPHWKSFVSPDDDKYHLNVTGDIQYEGKEASALIQFEILKNDRWQINSFMINGQPQSNEMVYELIYEMCNSLNN